MIDRIEARMRTSHHGKLNRMEPFKSGAYFKVYRFRNISIKVQRLEDLTNMSYIYISGSIPKFLYDNNLYETDLLMVKRFVMVLKKLTGLPIQDFEVTSLEIAANMNMSKGFAIYAHAFEYAPRFSRRRKYEEKGTINFNNASKSLLLYDKGKEYIEQQKSKGLVPFNITLTNLIRFEVRIKQYVPRIFEELKIADLYKKETFLRLVGLWEHNYFHIHKTPRPRLKYCESADDVKNYLILKGLEATGGKDELIKQLRDLRLLDKIPERAAKSLINTINKAQKSKVCIEDGDEVTELDRKVRKKANEIRKKCIGN